MHLGLAGFLCVILRMEEFFSCECIEIKSQKNYGEYKFGTSTISLRVVFMFAAVKILVDFKVAGCFSAADSTDQNVRYAFIFKVLYLLKTFTTTPFGYLFQTVLKEVFSLLLCCYNRTCEPFLFCHI